MQHGDIRRVGLRQLMAGFWRQYITETIAVIVHIVGCQAIFTVDRYSQKSPFIRVGIGFTPMPIFVCFNNDLQFPRSIES